MRLSVWMPAATRALAAAAVLMLAGQTAAQSVFVNELHYDNDGTDTGEAIEIAGPAGLDLTGCSVVLYNGATGAAYGTTALASVIPDQQSGFGTTLVTYGSNGIQNGSPDGIALVGAAGVIQFLSYEGTFTAVDGPAAGLASTDIGVAEAGGTPAGQSLQLSGSGAAAADFAWSDPAAASFGEVNAGQSFTGTPAGENPCGGGAGPGDPGALVINEIHADPAGDLAGDANGDGVRDAAGDEFVEIVNASDEDFDLSGWTLSDGAALRHTFPPGSIVGAGCAAVVFGGGTPTGAFGNVLVQTASAGQLGLNNGGDTVTLSSAAGSVVLAYGGEGGGDESITRDPDITGAPPLVRHTGAAGAGGRLFSPGTQVGGAQFAGCEPLPVGPFEIWEIQGAGAVSPLAGRLVQTHDNVVTAIGVDGFFMQTPAERSDGDPGTSDGVFVFTGTAPTVAVGDQVDVTAQVQEFFEFTELAGNPVVTVDAGGLPLPAPVAFDRSVPSPDPAAPSCALEYECYEAMLVSIAGGTVTGANQHFGSDPVAEVHVTAAPERAFREPGVPFPGLPGMPEIPVWDGNPEVFELDPDKLGLPNALIPAGSRFDAVGALGFEFGGYELWPSSLNVVELPIPRPVRARAAGEFTVGSLNLFRLFDDVNDPADTNAVGEPRDDEVVSGEEYATRRAKLVRYVLEVLDAPDVLAVQEVEKLGVLEDLASDIAATNPAVVYTAYLEEGNDVGTIDVGFLVRDTIAVDAVTQLGRDEILEFDGSPLHDRPPLLLEGRADEDFPVVVMNVHNRSLGGVEDPGSGGERVRLKRLTQAQSIAARVQSMQEDDPDVRLVVVGDFNAFEFTDGFVDAIGQIKGEFDPNENLLSGPDLVHPDLVDQVLAMEPAERYSFVFDGSAQVLDHALTSHALDGSVRGLAFGRGNADAAEVLIGDATTPVRSSDHDGLVLFLTTDRDTDGVNDDGDFCSGTVVPEPVPTEGLGVNRWALLDGDFVFDTPGPDGVGDAFTTTDTAGCSCAQIIDAQGLGKGHVKFGCSNDAMKDWIELVSP